MALIWPIIDRDAYGWEAGGDRPQVSEKRLNEHFLAIFEKQFDLPLTGRFLSPSLTRRRVSLANRGAERLRVRSRWDAAAMLARLDIDAHSPWQTDYVAAKAWADDLFGGLPYWNSETNRGGSGHLLIGRPPHWTARQMNELRGEIDEALSELAKAAGLKCGAEFCGGYLETLQRFDSDGVPEEPRRVVGGMGGKGMANLPRCETHEDVEKLGAATIPADAPLLMRIIEDGKRAKAERLEREAVAKGALERVRKLAAEETAEVSGEAGGQRPARVPPPADTEKHRLAFWSVAEARIQLGVRTREELVARRSEILEVAHEIYDSCGFSANARDKKRETRMAGAFRFMARTFDDEKVGSGGADIWFTTAADGDQNDVQAFVRSARGLGLQSKIAEANTWLKARRQPLLTEEKVGIMACTMVKNAELNEGGASPANAVLRMLQFFQMGASSSTVRQGLRVLADLGVLRMIRLAAFGICRGWQILKRSFFGFLPGADAEAGAKAQKAREIRASRRAFEARGAGSARTLGLRPDHGPAALPFFLSTGFSDAAETGWDEETGSYLGCGPDGPENVENGREMAF